MKVFPKICCRCGTAYYVSSKNEATRIRQKVVNSYCSIVCRQKGAITKITTYCKNCNTPTYKILNQFLKSKNHFCSKSCAASYNNKHKTKGNRRSKLETWLEQKLTELYPNLEIHYNKKDTIGSELDIYIPSLKLAFELNGIFHYEPIYGKNKLNQIQNNDKNKFQECQKLGISLCIIDTSSQNYFTEKSSKKYLDIILSIISQAN